MIILFSLYYYCVHYSPMMFFLLYICRLLLRLHSYPSIDLQVYQFHIIHSVFISYLVVYTFYHTSYIVVLTVLLVYLFLFVLLLLVKVFSGLRGLSLYYSISFILFCILSLIFRNMYAPGCRICQVCSLFVLYLHCHSNRSRFLGNILLAFCRFWLIYGFSFGRSTCDVCLHCLWHFAFQVRKFGKDKSQVNKMQQWLYTSLQWLE